MDISKRNKKVAKINDLIKKEEEKLKELLRNEYYEKIALEIIDLCNNCLNDMKSKNKGEPFTKYSAYINYKPVLLSNITEQSNYICYDDNINIQLYYEFAVHPYYIKNKTFPLDCDFEYLNNILKKDNINLSLESFTGKSVYNSQKDVNKMVVSIIGFNKTLINESKLKRIKREKVKNK